METYNTTKQLLINTALPETTRTYKCVEHERVMDLTLNAIDKAGFILDAETYTAASGGLIATGKYTIKNIADDEMQLQIAWLNSYNKKKSLTYGIGNQVFICQNGSISADMGYFKKKHQGEIQEFTPIATTEYIKRAEDTFVTMQKEREEMKQIEVSRRICAELLGRAVIEEEFITTTQLNIIKNELYSPTYDYGCPGSIYELYQFTTFALKGIHPSLWMKNHIGAHTFFTKEANIIPTFKENRMLELIGDPVDTQMSRLDMIPRT